MIYGLVGVVLVVSAGFFAFAAYCHVKGRLSGRPTALVPKIGNRRTAHIAAAHVYAWLAGLLAIGAVVSFGLTGA